MKKKFLNLNKQPITNSYLNNLSKKNVKKEYFYNLFVSFNTKNFLISISCNHVFPARVKIGYKIINFRILLSS